MTSGLQNLEVFAAPWLGLTPWERKWEHKLFEQRVSCSLPSSFLFSRWVSRKPLWLSSPFPIHACGKHCLLFTNYFLFFLGSRMDCLSQLPLATKQWAQTLNVTRGGVCHFLVSLACKVLLGNILYALSPSCGQMSMPGTMMETMYYRGWSLREPGPLRDLWSRVLRDTWSHQASLHAAGDWTTSLRWHGPAFHFYSLVILKIASVCGLISENTWFLIESLQLAFRGPWRLFSGLMAYFSLSSYICPSASLFDSSIKMAMDLYLVQWWVSRKQTQNLYLGTLSHKFNSSLELFLVQPTLFSVHCVSLSRAVFLVCLSPPHGSWGYIQCLVQLCVLNT